MSGTNSPLNAKVGESVIHPHEERGKQKHEIKYQLFDN